MAMQFKMFFSIKIGPSVEFMHLGSLQETVWSLAAAVDTFGRRGVRIFRSRSNGKVKFDVEVNNQGHNLVSIKGFLLSDGENSTHFIFSKYIYLVSSVIEGYLTVHYSFESTHVSKKEAVTQTEIDIISSNAEKSTLSPQLVDDFLRLLANSDSFSDATLICGTSKFPVHRNILSARSPVFAAMFRTQMQEGREGVVDIVDMEPDVLQAMLRYIYSGKTDHLTSSLAGDLLFAADKYQLEELKLICVEELKASMHENNVLRSLVLGDLHDENLKTYAVEFICKCKNFSHLEKSEKWKLLLKEHPNLAVEVLSTVVKYLQKK